MPKIFKRKMPQRLSHTQRARDRDATRHSNAPRGSSSKRRPGCTPRVGEHLADGLEGRLDPLPFGHRADLLSTGPAALAAEIEEGGPFRHHPQGLIRGRGPAHPTSGVE